MINRQTGDGSTANHLDKGLSEEQVLASRKQHGANRISIRKTRGFFGHLMSNFADPMIKILLIALAINIVFLFRNANWYETASIAVAVLLAVAISTLSEYGSESAFKRLQEDAAKIRCRVVRAGGLAELPVEEVVVGDLVRLEPGDRVPADGILISGELKVDQSALNGETKEAKKRAAIGDIENIPLSEDLLDKASVFSGTVVSAGKGVLRVKAVGDRTFYGMLAGEVQEETGQSPLKERLGELAGTISVFGYVGAALVTVAFLFSQFVIENGFSPALILAALKTPAYVYENVLKAVMLAVTVIVMAVPEGLPMMITVVLSSNMKRMLSDRVLVRKLVGIETAGSLNILFTDKTGTLTQGRLQATGLIDGSGKVWDDMSGLYAQPLWMELERALRYNSAAELSEGQAIGGNPTDRALLAFAGAHPLPHRLTKGREAPFDSKTKYMATEVFGEVRAAFVKGAPEVLLPHCTAYISADGRTAKFSPQMLTRAMARMQGDAARLIAVAKSEHGGLSPAEWKALTLIGVLAVQDAVREEAPDGVRQLQEAGIQVVMITGDAALTAEAIARQSGVLADDSDLVLTSGELKEMDDAQVAAALPRLRVVARALPHDKSRLIRIAQGQGLVVGMTGDGVNDAPALRHADVGFSMGSGTEIAKEASDIVILDDNLLSIAKAVRYGRTIFKSIRKFITFQLTLNFCAMGISIIAPLLGVDSPITVIQMLWINMVMDTLAGLAFAGEPALMEYMKEPPKKRDEPIINGYMWREIVFGGLHSIAICLWFLTASSAVRISQIETEARFMTAFFALFMFTGIFHSFCARTPHINLLDHLAGNKAFITIMATVSVVQMLLLYFGGPVFRTNGLSLRELAVVLSLSSTAVLAHLLRMLGYKALRYPSRV